MKNLKSKAQKKAKEITHGQGVSKSIDKEKCFPENALNPSYPYANFGYMENGVFYKSDPAKEESWEMSQKHEENRSFPRSGKELFCSMNFLKADVDGMITLLPKTGGISCRIDKNGVRLYEVINGIANGLYYIDLFWEAEGKECKMKISISDDGLVECIKSNGVTWEQLAAHKKVKVGRQYEAKPLYEALSYLKQEDSELIQGFYLPTSLESIQISTGVSSRAI